LAPIELAIDLDAGSEACFERFTEGFGEWWPTLTHSLSRESATRCAFEPRAGGRVFETAPGGVEHEWGTVTAAVPGSRVRFTWHPGRDTASAQWVEVYFEPAGGGCRAVLTHGGWEALGEIAPLMRREYVSGWQHVFGTLFAAYASRRH
jgi:uncharacterized protein YndB with AHSA1/START domain